MNRINKFISILLQLLFAIGCDKSDDSLSTPLNGRAIYVSPVNLPADTLLLSNQQVQVKDVTTGERFDLVTDSAGRFYLPGWSKERKFDFQTSFERNDTDEYQVVYTAKITKGGTDLKDVVLLASPDTGHYHSVLLSVKDIFGGKVTGAKVLIYTTRSIATLDSTFSGIGVLTSLITSQYGRCFAMKLPSDSLFIKSEYVFNDSTKLRSDILAIRSEELYTDTSVVIH